jgi:hypothetical protein
MFTFSVQLAQATDKGVAVQYDGTLAEDPTADTFAGITLGSGASGDYVAVAPAGSEVYAIAGAAIAAAGVPVEFGTDGKLVTSALTNGRMVVGFTQESASGDGEEIRVLVSPFATPSA